MEFFTWRKPRNLPERLALWRNGEKDWIRPDENYCALQIPTYYDGFGQRLPRIDTIYCGGGAWEKESTPCLKKIHTIPLR